MRRQLRIKDHIRETSLFTQRAVVALVGVTLLFFGIAARLVYLQIVNHETYTTLSRNNRVKLVPVAPTRGLIYDRNGVLLAENVPSFSLEVVPEQVEDMDATLAGLRELVEIEDAEIARFKKVLRKTRRFESIPLRYRLDEKEVARISVNRHRFPGVDIQARLIRRYPQGRLAAHVVGYVAAIDEEELSNLDASNYSATSHIGKTGIEKAYEKLLHGQVGMQQAEINARGRTLRVLTQEDPVPGRDLHLSLDVNLQALADAALGDYRGSVVALDPNNGDVLALVSKPTFDPNLFVTGVPTKIYNKLTRSRAQPLFNRAIRGQYPPGSTVKPFIGLAGLEYAVTSDGHPLFCPGWFTIKGDERRYRDWRKEGHGTTNLDKAITESCDVYFYDLAQTLRIDRIHEFMARFGFGQVTGIDLQGERTGINPSRAWKNRVHRQPWFPGETVITGIGQGFTLTTPLQLANSTAVLAMRGERHTPRLLRPPERADGKALESVEEDGAEPVILKNPAYWISVHQAMRHVVHGPRGTARASGHNARFEIAGKTGTAQVFGIGEDEEYEAEKLDKRLHDHSLFIAFAPADKPRIAVAVVAENAGSGSAIAAPIARKVIDYYLIGGNR